MKYGKLTSRHPARRGSDVDRIRAEGVSARTAFDDLAGQLRDSLLGNLLGAVGLQHHRRRVDATHQVGPTGRGVVVGGVVERLDRDPQRGIGVNHLGVQLLDRRLGEDRARSHRLIALFLEVPAACGIERHDAARRSRIRVVEVITGQQRQRDESLQRRTEIAAHHGRQPVHLAGERQRYALDLLVVLELDGIQAGEFDGDRRGACDARRGVVVGDVHLLHVATGDHVALRGAPVARHHHAAGILQRNDRGAVRQGVGRRRRLVLAPDLFMGRSSGA